MLQSTDVIDIQYKQGVCTLGIVEVFPDDEGEYMCKAVNEEGTDTTSCFLAVIDERKC